MGIQWGRHLADCPSLPPSAASLPLLTDSLIQALAALEKAPVPEAGGPESVPPLWGNPRDPIHVFLLDRKSRADTKLEGAELNPELRALISEVAHHSVHGQQELGVVLAPDGSTVAVEPLLAGLAAGKQGRRAMPLPWDSRDTTFPAAEDTHSSLLNASARPPSSLDSLLGVTLARNLGLAFLRGPQNRSRPGLGSDGCWDQLSAPRNFTLLDPEPSPLTVAFLNGAVDGLILGDYLNRTFEPQPALSQLLSQYYGKGVAGKPALHSSSRRQNAAPLAATPTLARQVWGTLLLLQRLQPEHPRLKGLEQEELLEVATRAVQEFTESFLGKLPGCPPPRARRMGMGATGARLGSSKEGRVLSRGFSTHVSPGGNPTAVQVQSLSQVSAGKAGKSLLLTGCAPWFKEAQAEVLKG